MLQLGIFAYLLQAVSVSRFVAVDLDQKRTSYHLVRLNLVVNKENSPQQSSAKIASQEPACVKRADVPENPRARHARSRDSNTTVAGSLEHLDDIFDKILHTGMHLGDQGRSSGLGPWLVSV